MCRAGFVARIVTLALVSVPCAVEAAVVSVTPAADECSYSALGMLGMAAGRPGTATSAGQDAALVGGRAVTLGWFQLESFPFETDYPLIRTAARDEEEVALPLWADLAIGDGPQRSDTALRRIFASDGRLDGQAQTPTAEAWFARSGVFTLGDGEETPVGDGSNGVWRSLEDWGFGSEGAWIWGSATWLGYTLEPGLDRGGNLLSGTGVPEPSATLLLLVGLAVLRRHRKMPKQPSA